MPDLRVVEAFDRAVSPFFARIQANSQESRTLATLRDTLAADAAERGVERNRNNWRTFCPMNKPYSIKIFLPGGDPDGLRTIEKSNWSGAGIVIPRALMGEAKSRRELTRTGVYVLVGPPEESGLPRVYVGEGDPIKPRLE